MEIATQSFGWSLQSFGRQNHERNGAYTYPEKNFGIETPIARNYCCLVNETTRKITFFVIKTAVILALLGAVFVRVFLISVTLVASGPTSGAEAGDLPIREAHLDVSQDALFLVTTDRWARVELKQKGGGIFIHWSDFIVGRPSVAQLTNTEPVSVMGAQGRNTPIPDGFSAALYNGAPGTKDNRMWVESYILVTTMLRADGHHFVKFFYNPWVQTVSFHPQIFAFFIYGPSYIALCIALPLGFSKVRASIFTVLFIIAFLLHGVSSLFIATLCGIGKAWNGDSSDFPTSFLVSGWIILFVLLGVWVVRSSSLADANKRKQ